MKTLLDSENFIQTLEHSTPLTHFKGTLRRGAEQIGERYLAGEPQSNLVALRAALVDFVLQHAWDLFLPARSQLSLVAVGGYGRGELHPHSDVDLLVLIPEAHPPEEVMERLGDFIRFLWDIRLEVGHSVRTLRQCAEEAAADLTVITNLIESRFLCGNRKLFEIMRRNIATDNMWPSAEFFRAKLEEQRIRHRRGDEASNLEPNIKECPGGLRDIQTIGWVMKRHFDAADLSEIVREGFLNEAEYTALDEAQQFLWRIRFALHLQAGRHEDRLLFDLQRTLAKQFGYEDLPHSLAVEQFMQQFYRNVQQVAMLNERLLQLFDEVILQAGKDVVIEPLNERFQSHNDFIEVTHEQVFAHHPEALLEIFLLLQQHPRLRGIRASTIRLIRHERHRLGAYDQLAPEQRELFLEILRQPRRVDRALRRMHRYGVLGNYLPAFRNITGRMQFDLFHMFTVDEHTLVLLRNLHRFRIPRHVDEFPLASQIMGRLNHPELLYLAGLFHDIAKGRGGDHSTLGMKDARDFCIAHGLDEQSTELVVWLVQHHLLMSMVAQRQDINDPEVVLDFARRVGSIRRLDYLYLLTVADIRATDPRRWNSWKDSLLRQLYHKSNQAMVRGLDSPERIEELAQRRQLAAIKLMIPAGISEPVARSFWTGIRKDYFPHYSPEALAWHVECFLSFRAHLQPSVYVRKHTGEGCSEILVLAMDRKSLFADTTYLLDRLRLNIVNARIETTAQGTSLDSYLVLEETGGMIKDDYRVDEVINSLQDALRAPRRPTPDLQRPETRQQREFTVHSRIDYCRDPTEQYTVLKLSTADRRGLLAVIGRVFDHCSVRLHSAKIATLGAEAEDSFFITDQDGNPLKNKQYFDCLHQQILSQIDS